MCERCDEIDKKIERYRRLARSIIDQPALEGIDRLIAALEETKVSFHSKAEK
jgi:hypothetical protein